MPRRSGGESKAPGRKHNEDATGSGYQRPPRHDRYGDDDDGSVAGSVAGSMAGSVAGSVMSRVSGGSAMRPGGTSAKERYRRMRKLRMEQEAQRRHQRAGGALAASGLLADAAGQMIGDDLRAKIEETHKLAHAGDNADPEVHIIGEVVGGEGFEDGSACKWVVQAGDNWKLLEGSTGGQTHVIYKSTVSKIDVWAHPIDVHYVAGSLDGWPRILLQVWKLDTFGRHELQGYGFIHIPPGAGSFDLEVPTWRPVGDTTQEMTGFFIGGVPQLKDTDLLYSRATDRKYLVTTGSGRVHIHIDVILKHMDQHGVEW